MASLPPQLQRATTLLQSGQRLEARGLLLAYVRSNADAEAAWLLLSQALDDPKQKSDCLRQVLRINPRHYEARRLLGLPPEPDPAPDAFAAAPPPARPAQATPPAKPGLYPGQSPPPPPPPAPAAAKAQRRSWRKQSGLRRSQAIALAVLGLVVLGITISALVMALGQVAPLMLGEVLPTARPALPEQATEAALLPPTAVIVPSATLFSLPPTWTPTPQPSPTNTLPPVTPVTPSPSPLPTLMPPAATPRAAMERIQLEVADIRGLPILGRTAPYIAPPAVIEQMLMQRISTEATQAELTDLTHFLSSLGLVKPTYDLVRYSMNGLVDNIGGFYDPETKEIYLLGLQFGGMEHAVYAHEYTHALTDQHFDLQALILAGQCGGSGAARSTNDQCLAMRSLIEGDANQTMALWFAQYGTARDISDIRRWRPPYRGIPEQNPPPYLGEQLNFPYEQGASFVETLYNQGRWERVNQAYRQLPQSSEQIMHPSLYLSNHAPIAVNDPPLELALGSQWRKIADDVLGEWMTFAILAHSDDRQARQSEKAAAKAAAGWGGDQVQVYYQDGSGSHALAAHWVWDTPGDAKEHADAMNAFLLELSRGQKITRPAGSCYRVIPQIFCFYHTGSETLALSAPDEPLLDAMQMLFPIFAP